MNKWKFLGWLPFIILLIIWFISLIYYKRYESLIWTVIFIILIILSFKWGGYCYKKEREEEIK